jgi:molecular chaperone Hsp33
MRQADIAIPATRRKAPCLHDIDEDDAWVEAKALVDTVKDVELTDPEVSVEMLLFRLFHERGVRLFDPQPLADKCRCSREKIEGVLSGFSAEEIDAMTVDGEIVVTCEFCSTRYRIRS